MASEQSSGVTGQSAAAQQAPPLQELNLNLPAPVAQPATKKTKQPDWTDAEARVLCAAKKQEYFDVTMEGSTQSKMRTQKKKWLLIAKFMFDEGIRNPVRDHKSCKKKWAQIEEKFKKAWDWEKLDHSGQISYFDMTDRQRRQKNLPANVSQAMYEDLVAWYSEIPRVDPSRTYLADTSLLERSFASTPFRLSSDEEEEDDEEEDTEYTEERNEGATQTSSAVPPHESAPIPGNYSASGNSPRSTGPGGFTVGGNSASAPRPGSSTAGGRSSSPQDFSGPAKRGVKRKVKSGQERRETLATMAKSMEAMVSNTKQADQRDAQQTQRDIELREREILLQERQETTMARAVEPMAATAEQLARLIDVLSHKVGASSSK